MTVHMCELRAWVYIYVCVCLYVCGFWYTSFCVYLSVCVSLCALVCVSVPVLYVCASVAVCCMAFPPSQPPAISVKCKVVLQNQGN